MVRTTLAFEHDNRPLTVHIRRSTKTPEWVAESDNFPGRTIRAATFEEMMIKIHTAIPELLGE